MKRFPFAKTLKALYKPLPRMSKQSRQAVADNLWIVAALLAVVAALSLTSALSLLSQADHISLFGVAIFVPNIAIIRLQQIITLIFAITEIVLFGLAISPLRRKQTRGWLFTTAGIVVTFLATVVTFILSFFTHYYDVASGVVAIALVAAMGYVLSEIESEFDSAKADKPTTPKATDTPDQAKTEAKAKAKK
ncbi:hypothetical protein GWK76_02110 [Candidatus Saccharibacteria bacterium oral taxon 488]|jgi:hypothetical protein|nr:hypothetical protein GWK76_02110 [Candidatus Saccharibacteria bacterium oral taxon 488]QJU05018.1 hypothetical protein FBF32_02070 [Candidatus Saccharibacteria bacterium oral taxon 488]